MTESCYFLFFFLTVSVRLRFLGFNYAHCLLSKKKKGSFAMPLVYNLLQVFVEREITIVFFFFFLLC